MKKLLTNAFGYAIIKIQRGAVRGASRLTPNKSLVGKMRPAEKNCATLFNLLMKGNDIMKKLSAHPYAQCEIITAPAYAACKSYNTIVATIDEG